jgi:AcrR family transcriptional regulator
VRRIADTHPRGDKRQRILAAGLKLFAEQPYQSVTMDSVAQLADVAKGTLYLYFPSKESLYLGIISSGFEAAAQSHQAAIHPGMSVEERLRRAIATTIEFYDGQRDFLRLLATEEPRLAAARSRLLGGWRERGFNFFHSLIEEGIKAGVLRSTDSRLATLAIFGTIRSVLLFYGEQRPVTELSQDVGHFVLSGLLAPHRNSRRDSTR